MARHALGACVADLLEGVGRTPVTMGITAKERMAARRSDNGFVAASAFVFSIASPLGQVQRTGIVVRLPIRCRGPSRI